MEPFDLSVIICTLNRSGLLRKCLDSLARQEAAHFTFETIVVDNGSTDETKAVVDGFNGALRRLTYVYEAEKRVGRARNVGFRASTGRYVAYLDDDAVADPTWVASILQGFDLIGASAQNSKICLGGPVEPNFEIERPTWLTAEFEPIYTIFPVLPEVQPYPSHHHPTSANMAVPRAALVSNPWNDRLPMCEDGDLFRHLDRSGYQLIYLPQMRVRHFISARRLNQKWLLERHFAEGVAQNYLVEGLWPKSRIALADCLKLPVALAISALGTERERFRFRCKARRYVGFLKGFLGVRHLASTSYIAAREKASF